MWKSFAPHRARAGSPLDDSLDRRLQPPGTGRVSYVYSPSYRSCMMVLREGVRRYHRIPQIVVVNGGREFESTYFETMLAGYQSTKKERPKAKARFGSLIERFLGANNTQFVHNLQGNTQIMRNVRQVTKSVNPKCLATWPLAELYDRLCEYLYEVYDTQTIPRSGRAEGRPFSAGCPIRERASTG